MLTVEKIPPDNHLYRRSPEECYDASSNSFTEGAFLLRLEINETYLSVDWAERADINVSCVDPKTKKELPIAKLNVQDTLDLKLKVEHKPSKRNRAHSGIFGDDLFDEVLRFIKASELAGISKPEIVY